MFQARSRPGHALSASPAAVAIARAVAVSFLVVSAGASVLSAQLPAPARPPRPAGQAPAPAPAAELRKDAAAPLPSARSILDRHLEAIGGREAVLSHSSTHARGTLSVPAAGLNGTLEVYGAKPNRSFVRVSLPGVGEVLEGFDGTHAWSLSPMTGPMLLDGAQLEQKRFDSEFHAELRPDSRYLSITVLERTEFDGRPCYKVRFVKKSGGEDIEFYDTATGLKAGSIITRETHMGKITSTTVETDYRKFGNLLHASTLKQQIGQVEQVITIASIEYDTVTPSVFDIPAEIKALIK